MAGKVIDKKKREVLLWEVELSKKKKKERGK